MFREVHEHPIQGGPLCVAEFFSAQIRARHFQMGCGPEDGMAWIPPQSDMRGINRDQFPDLIQPGADVFRQNRVWLLRKLFEYHFHCLSSWMVPCRSHGVLARRSPGFRRGGSSLRSRANGWQLARRCTTAQMRSFHRPARHRKSLPFNLESWGDSAIILRIVIQPHDLSLAGVVPRGTRQTKPHKTA